MSKTRAVYEYIMKYPDITTVHIRQLTGLTVNQLCSCIQAIKKYDGVTLISNDTEGGRSYRIVGCKTDDDFNKKKYRGSALEDFIKDNLSLSILELVHKWNTTKGRHNNRMVTYNTMAYRRGKFGGTKNDSRYKRT